MGLVGAGLAARRFLLAVWTAGLLHPGGRGGQRSRNGHVPKLQDRSAGAVPHVRHHELPAAADRSPVPEQVRQVWQLRQRMRLDAARLQCCNDPRLQHCNDPRLQYPRLGALEAWRLGLDWIDC